jgi:hypothetical protein
MKNQKMDLLLTGLEQLTMATLLSAYYPGAAAANAHPHTNLIDPLFAEAKSDVRRVLEILEQVGNASPEMQKTRTDVLRSVYERIPW